MAEADPIKAAEALAGQTYQGAADRTAAGKQALLNQLSSTGTYQNTINQEAVQQGAPKPAPQTQPGDSQAPALAVLGQIGAQQVMQGNQASLAAAAALAAQSRQAQQTASSTYFDQTAAALPIEQSRATSEAQQIMQALIQEREQRANALALQQLQMEETKARIAAAAADRASGGGVDGMTPAQQLAFGQNVRDTEERALKGAVPQSFYKIDPATGNPVLNRRGTALDLMVDKGMSMDEAMAAAGLTEPSSRKALADAWNQYQQNLDEMGYFTAIGAARPAPLSSAAPPRTGQSVLYPAGGGPTKPRTTGVPFANAAGAKKAPAPKKPTTARTGTAYIYDKKDPKTRRIIGYKGDKISGYTSTGERYSSGR